MTSSRARTAPPPSGGTRPPDRAQHDGRTFFLAPLAYAVAERWRDALPDEYERYGDAGLEWCAYDMQWVISWSFEGADLLADQVEWLARVLEARGYARSGLATTLAIASDVMAEAGAPEVGSRLRERAKRVLPTA